VDLIKAAVERRNKVVVLGVGKSGHIGEKIAATLTSTGSTAVVLNSSTRFMAIWELSPTVMLSWL
jgi:arabinose-5-phosphate isomerase